MKTAYQWSNEIGMYHVGGDRWNKISPEEVRQIQEDVIQQYKPVMEALKNAAEILCEVSKCCCDLRDWDTIESDWVSSVYNKAHLAILHADKIHNQ